MEVVPRCVKARWVLPTALVSHTISYQLMEKLACLLTLQMEQQVMYPVFFSTQCNVMINLNVFFMY